MDSLLRVISIFFLLTTIAIGTVSYSDSTKVIDKVRFSYLTVGSILSLLFVFNV